VTKVGAKKVMALGFVATIAGLLWYTQIPVNASYASDLLPGYLLIGFALPFSFIPVSIAALAGVEQHEAGLASGLINTAQQVGGAIGVAVTSSVLLTHSDTLLKQGKQFPAAFTSGTQWAFWVTVGVAVAGLVATLVLIQDREIAAAEDPVTAPG
jgi:sugar phosphate permease